MTKFEKVRQEQFPITERLAYLDTSSSGLICKNAKDAMVKYINDRYDNAFGIANVTGAWAHADLRARIRNTSSIVSAAYCCFSCAGVSSARTSPSTIIDTR